MREILKWSGVVVSVGLAVVAFVYGWLAARTWKQASEVEIERHWLMESPEPETAHEFKITATMIAVEESAMLNQKAAGFTKWAVVYGTAASILGTLTGLL